MNIKSDQLLRKFNAGILTPEEEKELEARIESDAIDLNEIEFITSLNTLPTPMSSLHMDDTFYEALVEEKQKLKHSPIKALQEWWSSSINYSWHWGYSAALVLVGVLAGVNWPQGAAKEVATLRSEVFEMKELMMLTMLENESTTDRLKAVNLTPQLDTVSEKVSLALINTLRNDDNNNVRMATIQVLASYTDNPRVREGLVNSIQYQDSPLVQLALAELMVAMNEREASKAFDSLWKQKETPYEVKVMIKEKMQTLI